MAKALEIDASPEVPMEWRYRRGTQKRVGHQEHVGVSRQVEDLVQRPTNGHDYEEGLTPSDRYFTKSIC